MKEFTIIFQTDSGRERMKIVTNNKDSANKAFLLECTQRGEVAKYNIEHDAYDSFQFLLDNSYSQSGEYERRLSDVEQRFRNYIDRTTDQIKSMDEEMQRLKSAGNYNLSENDEMCFARYLKSEQTKISNSIKELESIILDNMEVALSNHEPLGEDVAMLYSKRDKLLEISKAITELLKLF